MVMYEGRFYSPADRTVGAATGRLGSRSSRDGGASAGGGWAAQKGRAQATASPPATRGASADARQRSMPGVRRQPEDTIRGKPPDERCTARQQHARPLLDDLERWLHATLATLSRKSDTAAAILYSLKLLPALTRYCDDGRIEIDNAAAE